MASINFTSSVSLDFVIHNNSDFPDFLRETSTFQEVGTTPENIEPDMPISSSSTTPIVEAESSSLNFPIIYTHSKEPKENDSNIDEILKTLAFCSRIRAAKILINDDPVDCVPPSLEMTLENLKILKASQKAGDGISDDDIRKAKFNSAFDMAHFCICNLANKSLGIKLLSTISVKEKIKIIKEQIANETEIEIERIGLYSTKIYIFQYLNLSRTITQS